MLYKKILISILSLLIFGCGGGVQSHEEWFSHPYYVERSSELDNFEGECEVIFLGDSRIEGGNWKEYDDRWCNFGIGGDASFGVNHRLSSITDKYQTKIVIQVGYNDLSGGTNSPESVMVQLADVFSQLHESGSTVYFTSVIVSQNNYINSRIESLNSLLYSFCEKNDSVFVDVNEVLTLDGVLRDTYDGVHLTKEGYDLFVSYIEDYL